MYDIIYIHSRPVSHQSTTVEISTLSTIPEHLRNAITIIDCELQLDNVEGFQTVPMGSVICYEKSDRTVSGYNCWAIGKVGIDLVKKNGIFYTKPIVIPAMLIPAKEDVKPVWVNSCNLTYNGDGTATMKTDFGQVTGRIGIDFILCHGMKSDGGPAASILATYDESYNDYIICDEAGNDIGKLCELYPA
ncbi:MAG: hypothetical protein IJE68_02210 [Clostridia bacterium]|nr:hypothetical protein [Clostridia bacterium]